MAGVCHKGLDNGGRCFFEVVGFVFFDVDVMERSLPIHFRTDVLSVSAFKQTLSNHIFCEVIVFKKPQVLELRRFANRV